MNNRKFVEAYTTLRTVRHSSLLIGPLSRFEVNQIHKGLAVTGKLERRNDLGHLHIRRYSDRCCYPLVTSRIYSVGLAFSFFGPLMSSSVFLFLKKDIWGWEKIVDKRIVFQDWPGLAGMPEQLADAIYTEVEFSCQRSSRSYKRYPRHDDSLRPRWTLLAFFFWTSVFSRGNYVLKKKDVSSSVDRQRWMMYSHIWSPFLLQPRLYCHLGL